MASSQNSKNRSGLRILWIPGKRKSHPKGRLDYTNKNVSYSTAQKKSEVWSLGGSKAQKDFLNSSEDSSDIQLFEGPSGSSVSRAITNLVAAGAVTCASTDGATENSPNSPSSNAPTELLVSEPSSAEPLENIHNSSTMPSKSLLTVQITNPTVEHNHIYENSNLKKDKALDNTTPLVQINGHLNSPSHSNSSTVDTAIALNTQKSEHKAISTITDHDINRQRNKYYHVDINSIETDIPVPKVPISAKYVITENKPISDQLNISPKTPSSTASTALLLSERNSVDPLDNIHNSNTMPSKSLLTVQITNPIVENNHIYQNSNVGKGKEFDKEIDYNTTTQLVQSNGPLNSSVDSNSSTVDTLTPSITPKSEHKSDKESGISVASNSKHRNKHQQPDLNSIETDDTGSKVPINGFDSNHDILTDRHIKDSHIPKTKHKKKKKRSAVKGRDQLDGVPNEDSDSSEAANANDEDERIVKCLYYTLMCCDCSIS